MKTLRISVWSGPRNVSTALMYSFAQRADARVVDEPLYGHYLKVTGAPHPARDELLTKLETDAGKVVREVILGPCDRPVLFLKQMAHHLVELDWSFLERTANVLLIREPSEVLRSLVHQLPEPTMLDTGMALQRRILDYLEARGQEPPVLDSRELLLDPRGVLGALCERLGIPFDESMLCWPAGPRPEDGIWAEHWYHNLHRSTGFQPYRPKTDPFPERLQPLLDECREHYEVLFARALEAREEIR